MSDSLAAIVLAAGKGTRMRSPVSKLLHSLLGEPLVFYPLWALHQAGVRELVIVVGHASREVERAVRALPFLADTTLSFVEQAEQRGTGHAVQLAAPALGDRAGAVLIACGDSPHLTGAVLQSLLAAQRATGAPLTVLGAELADPTGYGRLVRDHTGEALLGIVEERDAAASEKAIFLVNAGAYAVSPAFLREHIVRLEPKNAQGELYLTDLVAMAQGQARVVVAPSPDVVLGVNSQSELARSQALVQATIIRDWHERGVSIEPGDVTIGPRVSLAPGARIERGVTLLGRTRVGERAHLEHHAHLRDVEVAAEARILAFTYAEEAEIGPRALVGPVSRLRAGTVLEEGAEVGNFCEVKKSRIGKGSKAHHVSYLGDATLGVGVNIGAGTIICNYDGFNKPQSEIGDNVFVGSNATLVAPVHLGAGAYVAAGSTVTKPVPAQALAVGRARQENKEGYAEKLRGRLRARKQNGGK